MPVEPPCLFVYGTLQPGHLRWPFLEPFAIGHGPADVYGELFDSGYGWPVARLGTSVVDRVPGTLVDLDPERADEALAVMDDVEATATDLFVARRRHDDRRPRRVGVPLRGAGARHGAHRPLDVDRRAVTRSANFRRGGLRWPRA